MDLPPPPGIDDWAAPEGVLSPTEVKELRIGRKLLMHGWVEFGYPEDSLSRRGVVHPVEGPPLEVYFIGWRYRCEGVRTPGHKAGWSGVDHWDPGSPSEFSMKRRVLVVQVKRGPGSRIEETLPSQVTRKR